VEHIIPREPVSLLHNRTLKSQQGALNTQPQSDRTTANNQNIQVTASRRSLVFFQRSKLVIALPQVVRLPVVGFRFDNLVDETCVLQLKLLLVMLLLQVVIVEAAVVVELVRTVGSVRWRIAVFKDVVCVNVKRVEHGLEAFCN